MKMLTFSMRTTKEIVRDPIYMAFGIGFPLGVLLLLTAIQSNLTIPLFEIQNLAPGSSVFGLSFMTLYAATLVSKDRTSTLLQRLYTTPLSAKDYIIGYTLPLLPIGLLQTIMCYGVSILLGLTISWNLLYAILLSIPTALFFIALGLLLGTLCNDKQVGGICGPLLTNLAAWLSGVWFDLSLIGGWFKAFAYTLPFVHAVEVQRMALLNNMESLRPHLWWVVLYAVITCILAICIFTIKMKKNS